MNRTRVAIYKSERGRAIRSAIIHARRQLLSGKFRAIIQSLIHNNLAFLPPRSFFFLFFFTLTLGVCLPFFLSLPLFLLFGFRGLARENAHPHNKKRISWRRRSVAQTVSGLPPFRPPYLFSLVPGDLREKKRLN